MANLYSIAALLLLAILPVRGQTNFFPLLPVGDKTYTNATITRVTPAEATVLFDGGGAQVALSNLPPELRERYHYDPAKAASYLAAQAERKAAWRKQDAEAAAREAALSEPVQLKILEHSGGEKFVTDFGTIWLKNVPAQTIQFLANRIQLANQVNGMNARVEANEREAHYANALAATNAYYNYYNPFYDPVPYNMQANFLTDSVNQQKIELERQLKVYDDYNRQGEYLTTVIASKTAKQYMGIDIWTCFGIAPQTNSAAPPTQ